MCSLHLIHILKQRELLYSSSYGVKPCILCFFFKQSCLSSLSTCVVGNVYKYIILCVVCIYRSRRVFMVNLQAVMFYSEWGMENNCLQEPTTPTPPHFFHTEPGRCQGVEFCPWHLPSSIVSISLSLFVPIFLSLSFILPLTLMSVVDLKDSPLSLGWSIEEQAQFCDQKHWKQ